MATTKKVLVIGGSGFMGSHTADELSKRGHEVTLMDRSASPWLQTGQTMVLGDILDEALVQKTVADHPIVYHYAGIADIGQASEDPLATVKANILGSAIILDACIRAGVERFIFASSMYVYSDKGSFYRTSKQAVEGLIETYQEKHGLDYTILRYGSLYGNRSQDWNGLRHIITQAVQHGIVNFRGDGKEEREYIHGADAGYLSVEALKKKYANSCLTVTGTQVLSTSELIIMIEEIIGKPIKVNYAKNHENHYVMTPYRYTPKRARKIVPKVFVEVGHGILDMVAEINRREDEHTDTAETL